MKIAVLDNHSVESNIQGRTVAARVDPMQIGMMMDMLARNYNSPHTAVLREYVSNGYDSHKAAGVERPVEVTLPTEFAPVLKVQDFGVGLSPDEVEEIYSVFGASTKRDDNTGIGGFGIGAKSALALSDQFTVSSVKNGLRCVFVVTRVNGGIDYKFVMENVPTEDVNGVTVTIPFPSDNQALSYPETLEGVLSGWSRDEVKVLNAPDFTRIVDDWIELEHGYVSPEVFKRGKTSSRSAGNIFVGPVRYDNNLVELPRYYVRDVDASAFASRIVNSPMFALKAPIGTVTFPSSREVIERTTSNKERLMELALEFYSEFKSLVKEKISEISNLSEAVDFRFSRVNVTDHWLGDDVFRTWNGHDFDDVVHVKEISENNTVPSFNDKLFLDSEYVVIVNDTDLAYGTIRRTLADINKFNLSDYKAFVPNANKNAVAIMDKDSIPEVVSYLASEKIEFSKIREAVIAARKIDAENKKKAGVTPKKKDVLEERSIGIFGTNSDGKIFSRHSTLGEVKNDMTEYKVYALEKASDANRLHRHFPLPTNTMVVVPVTNIVEKTFEKYVEVLGAEKVTEKELIAKLFESTMDELVSDENWETHKRIIKSPIINQYGITTSSASFTALLEDELVDAVNKIQENANLRVAINEIQSGNTILGDKLGIKGEEIGTSDDFALVSALNYNATRAYNGINATHHHLADYMNTQWKQMKESL